MTREAVSLNDRLFEVEVASAELSRCASDWLEARVRGHSVYFERAERALDEALRVHRAAVRRLERTRKKSAPPPTFVHEP